MTKVAESRSAPWSATASTRWSAPWSALAPVAWLGVFVILPMATLLTTHVDVADATRVLSRASTRETLWFSVWQAVVSVLFTFALATPVTWLVGRHDFRGRRVLRSVASIGFLLPSIVVSAGFLALLPNDLDTSLFAVFIAHAYFNVAVVLRVVAPRLESLDTRLMWAARTLGAGPLRTVVSVWWPALRGAIVSAGAVIFIYCFSSYAVVRTLGGPSRNTLESDIAVRAYAIGDIGGAVVLSLLQIATIVVVVLLGRRVTRDANFGVRRTRVTLGRLANSRTLIARSIAIVTVGFVLAPLAALAVSSLRVGEQWSIAGWRAVFSGGIIGSTSPLQALWSSARTAFVASIFGVVLAVLMSHAVTRLGTRGRWLEVFAMLPLAVSPVTLGLGLIVTFDEHWYDWRSAWWFVAVVHTIVAFPLAVRVLVPSWRNVSPVLRDAAAVLGASPARRLLDIDLRLLRPAIVAAIALIGAVSLGEFGAASMLSRSGAETLPVAISRLLGRTGDVVRTQAFVLATLLVVACLAALLVIDGTDWRTRPSRKASRARSH